MDRIVFASPEAHDYRYPNIMQHIIRITAALLLCSIFAFAQTPNKKKKKKPRPMKAIPTVIESVHPLFALENIDSLGTEQLRIGGMCFHKDSLYVTVLSPDRTNKKPDHQGQVLRIDNLVKAGKNGEKIKVTTLVEGLYEPCAISVIGDSVYVGEKRRIVRFDKLATKDKADLSEAVVLVPDTSTINFHTYTIGFEKYDKDGETYLCGNFTTAVLLGGKRDKMTPENKEIHRGSNFIMGPVTGNEKPEDIKIEYLAGGFRTPNGVEVGPENEVYVADNQGIFNPSNELIRIKPGSFYGHYLHTKGGKAAAYQPTDIDSDTGSPKGQTAATVHLPQSTVARSPAQPHVIRNRKGVLAPYNGQILLCEFTMGGMLRVAMEEVQGVWQGVVFKHSGGSANKEGKGGFTAGPNRIEVGPDGNYYIGQIGAGRLWSFNNKIHGLQRFRVKSAQEVDKAFNEILTVKAVEGGFEIEFLKPIDKHSIKAEDIQIAHWTYQPTSSYGGPPIGTQKLKAAELIFDSTGKKATLKINGLKDDSEKYVIKSNGKSSENSGWVVHVQFDPKANGKSLLYTKEFWYTLHRKIGGKAAGAGEIVELTEDEQIHQKFQSLCISCHIENDAGWAAPNLKGILGRKQTIIRNGKEEEVTVSRDYIINAIVNPSSEKPKAFINAAMPPLGISKKEAGALADYILKMK